MASAQPLPLPPPAKEMGPMDIMLLAGAGATGGTHPDAVVGAAQTAQSPDEAATNAQAIAGYADAARYAQYLKTQSPAKANDSYEQLSPKLQAAVKAAGWTPANESGGILGDVTRGIGAIPGLVGRGIGDISNALGAPLRAEQHVERSIIAGAGDQGLSWFVTPKDWAQSWDETSNGTSYIDPGFKQHALATFGPQTYALAYKLATGQNQQQILAGYSAAQQQQIGVALQSAAVQNATNYLNAGHLSEGREIAGMLLGGYNEKPGSGFSLFNLISGSVDGLLDWFGDPTVWGGKVAESAYAARYMVRTVEDVDNLFGRNASVQRAGEDLAQHIGNVVHNGYGMDELISRYPKLEQGGAIQQLVAAQADTADKVRKFFGSGAGLDALLRGRAAHAGEAAMLPHLSYLGVARLGAKGVLSRTMRLTADHTDSLPVEPGDLAVSPLTPIGGATGLRVGRGKYVTRLLRLVPEARTFKATDPGALGVLRDILSMLHDPQDADRILTAFATNPDLSQRFNIFRSAIMDMGRAAGYDADPERWQRFEETVDRQRYYAPGDLDVDYNLAGQQEHVGIFKAHLNDTWLIPSFKDMYVDANKGRMLNAMFRASNADVLDRMMSLWRPLTLARLGFATRVGGEEALGFILREGPLAYLKAQQGKLAYNIGRVNLAASGAKVFKAGELEQALEAGKPMEEIWAGAKDAVTLSDHGRMFNWLARGLAPAEADQATSIADLWSRSFANAVARTMERAGGAFTTGEYKAAIDKMVARGALEKDSYFWDHLTAAHGYDPSGDQGSYQTVVKDQGSGKWVNAEVKYGRNWMLHQPAKGGAVDENMYRLAYQRVLGQIASDDWAREALVGGRTFEETTAILAEKLLNDPIWEEQSRWSKVAQGKSVGDGPGQISKEDAAQLHAHRIVKAVNRMVRSPDGHYLMVATGGNPESLHWYMLRTGKAPPWWASKALVESGEPAQLADLAFADLPREVAGPEILTTMDDSKLRQMTNWMFRKYIGPQINWLSRQPMFVHNFVEAEKAYAPMADHWRALGMDEAQVADRLFERAQERAVNSTIPYIHNPELRSQFSNVTRNLMPFWFAQEQFYKRWARTFVFSPWAYRQLQLISGGLGHSGFVHTDPENGQEYFVYPGSATAVDLISHVLGAFGIKDEVPVDADLRGYVSMLNPGMQRGFVPNFGPLASVPMDGLASLDTHMFGALGQKMNMPIDWLLGSQAQSGSYLTAVLPTLVARAGQAVDPQFFAPAQYASAITGAVKYLDATGHGMGYPALRLMGNGSPPKSGHFLPGDYYSDNGTFWVYQPGGNFVDNSPAAMQTYLTRVQNWARVFMGVRALYGFAGPASPENLFDPKGMATQLQTLMNQMPFEQAVATFMTLHPDATAMTVFGSQTTNGGFLPATTKTWDFIKANQKMFTGDNSAAATYFLPPPDTSGNFNLTAYQQESQLGLRQQKAPDKVLNEIAYQEASNVYYNVLRYKDQAVATGKMQQSDADQMWSQYSAQFMLANPLFAQMYSDTGAVTRERIMTEVGNLVNDPSTPQSPQTAAVRTLYRSYRAWQSVAGNYGQPNAPSSSVAYNENVAFAQWVSDFVKEHPGVEPLVQRVIEPMLASTLTNLAAQGTALQL